MATLKGMKVAKSALLRLLRETESPEARERSRHTANGARRYVERTTAIRKALMSLDHHIETARIARNKDIAERGALPVTTPWRVGEWQEGESYEWEPYAAISDNAGAHLFTIEAGDEEADAETVAALALAADIVKAVNMHDRLVKTCETARHLCRVANGRAYCKTCASLPECEIANLLKEAKATQS